MRTRRRSTVAPPSPVPAPPPVPERLPASLTFFLTGAQRRAVLERLARIHRDRARALLDALRIDDPGDTP
jgi:hypothetical protein